jgi:hypothetical protein
MPNSSDSFILSRVKARISTLIFQQIFRN